MILQLDRVSGRFGTLPMICVSVQVVTLVMGTPAMVALGQLPEVGQVLGRLPNP